MNDVLTADDLAVQERSARDREVLARRAAILEEFSLQGILNQAEDTSDVPVLSHVIERQEHE